MPRQFGACARPPTQPGRAHRRRPAYASPSGQVETCPRARKEAGRAPRARDSEPVRPGACRRPTRTGIPRSETWCTGAKTDRVAVRGRPLRWLRSPQLLGRSRRGEGQVQRWLRLCAGPVGQRTPGRRGPPLLRRLCSVGGGSSAGAEAGRGRGTELTSSGSSRRGITRRSSLRVSAPRIASTGSPRLRWKSASAIAVLRPKMPSTRPVSKPRAERRRCRSATSSPRSIARRWYKNRSPSLNPASTNAAQVWGPHVPSTRRPLRCWKASTAARVPGP